MPTSTALPLTPNCSVSETSTEERRTPKEYHTPHQFQRQQQYQPGGAVPLLGMHTPTRVAKNVTRPEYQLVSRSSPLGSRQRQEHQRLVSPTENKEQQLCLDAGEVAARYQSGSQRGVKPLSTPLLNTDSTASTVEPLVASASTDSLGAVVVSPCGDSRSLREAAVSPPALTSAAPRVRRGTARQGFHTSMPSSCPEASLVPPEGEAGEGPTGNPSFLSSACWSTSPPSATRPCLGDQSRPSSCLHSSLDTATHSPAQPPFDPAYTLFVPAERHDTQVWASPTSPLSMTRPRAGGRAMQPRPLSLEHTFTAPLSTTATPTKVTAATARQTGSSARIPGEGGLPSGLTGARLPGASQTRFFADPSPSCSGFMAPPTLGGLFSPLRRADTDMATQVFTSTPPGSLRPATHAVSQGGSPPPVQGPPKQEQGLTKSGRFNRGECDAETDDAHEVDGVAFWQRGTLGSNGDLARDGDVISPVSHAIDMGTSSLDTSLEGCLEAPSPAPQAPYVAAPTVARPTTITTTTTSALTPSRGVGFSGSGEHTPMTPCTPIDRIISVAHSRTPGAVGYGTLGLTPGGASRALTPHLGLSQPTTPQKSTRRPPSHRTPAPMSFTTKAVNVSLEAQSQLNVSLASAAPSPAPAPFPGHASISAAALSASSSFSVEAEAVRAVPAFDDHLTPSRNPYSAYRVDGVHTADAFPPLPHAAVVVCEQTIPVDSWSRRLHSIETTPSDARGGGAADRSASSPASSRQGGCRSALALASDERTPSDRAVRQATTVSLPAMNADSPPSSVHAEPSTGASSGAPVSMTWAMFARRQSLAPSTIYADSHSALSFATGHPDSTAPPAHALQVQDTESPSPNLDSGNPYRNGKLFGASSGSKSEPSDHYGVSLTPGSHRQTHSQSQEHMLGSLPSSGTRLIGSGDDVRWLTKETHGGLPSAPPSHGSGVFLPPKHKMGPQVRRKSSPSHGPESLTPRKRLFSPPSPVAHATPTISERGPNSGSPSPVSLTPRANGGSQSPDRRLFCGSPSSSSSGTEEVHSGGTRGAGTIESTRRGLTDRLLLAPSTTTTTTSPVRPSVAFTESSTLSPDRFLSTQRGLGGTAFPTVNSNSTSGYTTSIGAGGHGRVSGGGGSMRLGGAEDPIGLSLRAESVVRSSETAIFVPMEALAPEANSSTELRPNPHATPGSYSCATRAPHCNGAGTGTAQSGVTVTSATTHTDATVQFTPDTSSASDAPKEAGGQQQQQQPPPPRLASLALPPRVTITEPNGPAPAAPVYENDFLIQLSEVQERLSRSSNSRGHAGRSATSSVSPFLAAAQPPPPPYRKTTLQPDASQTQQLHHHWLADDAAILSVSARRDLLDVSGRSHGAFAGTGSSVSMGIDFGGGCSCSDNCESDVEGPFQAGGMTYPRGNPGEATEVEDEPGDRFRQHHTFQFAHVVPVGKPLASTTAPMFIPLSADANGLVWLATHRLDGLPYAVKEVAVQGPHQRRQLAVELECLTLGYDATTAQQHQAEAFLARYFTCKAYTTAVMCAASLSTHEVGGSRSASPRSVHTGAVATAATGHGQRYLSLSPQNASLGNSVISTLGSTSAGAPVVVLLQTEYFRHGSLWEYATHKHRCTPTTLACVPWAAVMEHCLMGLEALHASELVHGCPLPFNIFVCDGARQFKLGNFGNAAKKPVEYPRTVPSGYRPLSPSAVTPYQCDVYVLCSGLLSLFVALLAHRRDGGAEGDGDGAGIPLAPQRSRGELAELALCKSERLTRELGCSTALVTLLQESRKHALSATEALRLLGSTSLAELAACRTCDEEITALEHELDGIRRARAHHSTTSPDRREGWKADQATGNGSPARTPRSTDRSDPISLSSPANLPPLAPGSPVPGERLSRHPSSRGSHGHAPYIHHVHPVHADLYSGARRESTSTVSSALGHTGAVIQAVMAESFGHTATPPSVRRRLSAHAEQVAAFYVASCPQVSLPTFSRPLTSWEHL